MTCDYCCSQLNAILYCERIFHEILFQYPNKFKNSINLLEKELSFFFGDLRYSLEFSYPSSVFLTSFSITLILF